MMYARWSPCLLSKLYVLFCRREEVNNGMSRRTEEGMQDNSSSVKPRFRDVMTRSFVSTACLFFVLFFCCCCFPASSFSSSFFLPLLLHSWFFFVFVLLVDRSFTLFFKSPWYNRTGWLGVSYTKLVTYCFSIACFTFICICLFFPLGFLLLVFLYVLAFFNSSSCFLVNPDITLMGPSGLKAPNH